MRNLDPDVVAFFAWFREREEIEQLIADDDAAPVIVQTADGPLRLLTGVPASRAECPTRRTSEGYRICGRVRCKHHAALTNDDGRPWNGPRHTLRAWWMESPQPPTCSLDLAEQVRANFQRGATTEEMSRALGAHPTLIRRRVKESLKSLKARGVDAREWREIIADEEQRAAEKP